MRTRNLLEEDKIKKDICEIGLKLYDKGYVVANDGNISVRLNEDEILVTPTGVSKGSLTPERIVKMNLNGEILQGNNKPSSEVKMHIRAYKLNPSIKAVVHSHAPLATAFAVCRIQLDMPIIAEGVVNLGIVPVAEYSLPGTDAVPNSIEPYVNKYNACLLANHGLLTWGRSIEEAFLRHESVEHYCQILKYVKEIGQPITFKESQIDELLEIRRKLGIKTGGRPIVR